MLEYGHRTGLSGILKMAKNKDFNAEKNGNGNGKERQIFTKRSIERTDAQHQEEIAEFHQGDTKRSIEYARRREEDLTKGVYQKQFVNKIKLGEVRNPYGRGGKPDNDGKPKTTNITAELKKIYKTNKERRKFAKKLIDMFMDGNDLSAGLEILNRLDGKVSDKIDMTQRSIFEYLPKTDERQELIDEYKTNKTIEQPKERIEFKPEAEEDDIPENEDDAYLTIKVETDEEKRKHREQLDHISHINNMRQ